MLTLNHSDIPPQLTTVPNPPERLYLEGAPLEALLERPRIAIVGSRKVTSYGRGCTEQIAAALSRSGAVVVSGLALGVDSIAHQAALDANGTTIAVLPGPTSKIYPASHTQLAKRIVEEGGSLLSEYASGSGSPRKHQFIDRNRLISGLSDAVVIAEAAIGSGSLHTARLAREQGRPVYAVPGPITSPGHAGTNQLIADGHAQLITSPEALVEALGLDKATQSALPLGDTPEEQAILRLMQTGLTASDALLAASQLSVMDFDQAITMLEINGHIKNIGNGHWRLV